jgi:hypothetical protein
MVFYRARPYGLFLEPFKESSAGVTQHCNGWKVGFVLGRDRIELRSRS